MKEIKRTQGHHACSQCDAVFGQAGTLRTHVRTVDEQGRTPLYHAAKAGDNDGSTLLITTALYGQDAVVEKLMEAGADVQPGAQQRHDAAVLLP